MRKIASIGVIFALILSVTYLFALDEYDTPERLISQLQQGISLEDIEYEEVGIYLSGIIYDESLSIVTLHNRLEEVQRQLSHQENCSRFCQLSHVEEGIHNLQFTSSQTGVLEVTSKDYDYTFEIRNQQDIHTNTYYQFRLTGSQDMEQIDVLRNRSKQVLSLFKVSPRESIYFRGRIEGKLDGEERNQKVTQLFEQLEATGTNYYEDDRVSTTCVYYGYTPYVKEHIYEQDGRKTNMQIGFKYNDLEDYTEVMIAFPFYNQAF